MPTYGYHCDNCGTEFDVWQSMTAEAKADCPSCGSPARRLFYPAGIVFKGSGFYKTDSRTSASSSSGSGPKSPSSSSSDGVSKGSNDSKSGGTSSGAKSETGSGGTPAKD